MTIGKCPEEKVFPSNVKRRTAGNHVTWSSGCVCRIFYTFLTTGAIFPVSHVPQAFIYLRANYPTFLWFSYSTWPPNFYIYIIYILTARCIGIYLKTVKTLQNYLKTEKYIWKSYEALKTKSKICINYLLSYLGGVWVWRFYCYYLGRVDGSFLYCLWLHGLMKSNENLVNILYLISYRV
jgi:hypothetical protein